MNSFSLAKLIFALFNCHGCFAEQFLQYVKKKPQLGSYFCLLFH